jgi:hypothetical protein
MKVLKMNNIFKSLLSMALVAIMILPTNVFASTSLESVTSRNNFVSTTTPQVTSKSTILEKELALNRTTNVDMDAVHAYLAQIDKDLKYKASFDKLMSITSSTAYGSAWAYTSSTSTAINCYGYATKFNAFINPGTYTFYYGSPLDDGSTATVDSIANWVLSDLGRCGRVSRIISSSTAPINLNEYRIALRTGQYGSTWDYHFMLQCSNGGWCEKPGSSQSKYDGMINPSTFSWNLYYSDGTLYKAGFYNSPVIYIAVKY